MHRWQVDRQRDGAVQVERPETRTTDRLRQPGETVALQRAVGAHVWHEVGQAVRFGRMSRLVRRPAYMAALGTTRTAWSYGGKLHRPASAARSGSAGNGNVSSSAFTTIDRAAPLHHRAITRVPCRTGPNVACGARGLPDLLRGQGTWCGRPAPGRARPRATARAASRLALAALDPSRRSIGIGPRAIETWPCGI